MLIYVGGHIRSQATGLNGIKLIWLQGVETCFGQVLFLRCILFLLTSGSTLAAQREARR